MSFSLCTLLNVAIHNDRMMTHPICMFALFYYPYSTWNSYYLISTGSYYDKEDLLLQINLCYLGLVSFCIAGLIVIAMSKKSQRNTIPDLDKYWGLKIPVKLSISISAFLIFLGIAEVSLSGAINKVEIRDLDSTFFQLSKYTIFFLIYGVLLYSLSSLQRRNILSLLSSFSLFSSLAVTSLSLFILAQRDFIFRLVYGLAAVYSFHKKSARSAALIGLLVAVALLIPLFGELRGLFLTTRDIQFSNYWDGIFINEFRAPSRNLYYMIYYGFEENHIYFVYDILRSLLSPFGDSIPTSSIWFNEVFRSQHALLNLSGWGFTIVGTGYLYGKSLGVVLVISSMSIVLHIFYFNRFRSSYWYVFYIVLLTSSIYCIRADLSAFLSQIKIIGSTAIFFWFISMRSSRKHIVKYQDNKM